MRVLFFGDSEWASESLRVLTRERHHVVGVVIRSQPSNTSLSSLTMELNLPLFQPENVNALEFIEQIVKLKPDLNISVSYDQILRRPIRDTAPYGFINFHAGRLPFYRGRSVLTWALINGETEIGITAHYVDDGIDTGDIILQRTVPVEWTDTYREVLHKVTAELPGLVSDTVKLIAVNRVQRQPQAHLPGTYFPARGPGDEWLDWSDTSRNLYNKIRALTWPGPGARTMLGDRVLILWKASYDPAWPRYIAIPGQVVGIQKNRGALVKTGDSTLLVERAHLDGEERMPVLRIGSRLGFNMAKTLEGMQNKIQRLEAEVARLVNAQ